MDNRTITHIVDAAVHPHLAALTPELQLGELVAGVDVGADAFRYVVHEITPNGLHPLASGQFPVEDA